MSEEILDWALFYHAKGLCVIPCKYGLKEPAVEWKPYQKERPTREQIEAWFKDKQLNLYEPGVGLGHRKCGSPENIAVTEIMQSFRYLYVNVFFATPRRGLIDVVARHLLHLEFKMRAEDMPWSIKSFLQTFLWKE